MSKDRYEISLWEDYLVTNSNDSNTPTHFEERKICIIGSNTETATCRAYEPKLVENVNGTSTFTFKMYYTFKENNIDDLIYRFITVPPESNYLLTSNPLYLAWKDIVFNGDSYTNPFLSLLVNERKVKVLWKDKWYDFIIKNIQEDSNEKSVTYTCKDLFINELSKNGFNLEFDNELQNNQGTVIELATRVLEGTEWQLDDTNSDLIKQEKEEPLYSATSKTITARNEKTGLDETIPADAQIYIFYSSVINKSNPCQFLYDSTQQYNRDTNSQLIIDVPCYSIETSWSEYNDHPPVPDELTTKANMGDQVSNEFRGSRLVNSQKSVLDPLTDKYVKVYIVKDNLDPVPTREVNGYQPGDEIYAYESTEYKDPTFVNNLIVNNKNFAKVEGWVADSGVVGPFKLYPEYNNQTVITTYSAISYLKLSKGESDTLVYNAGLRESSSYIPNGIQNGDKYIFRYKGMTNSGSGTSSSPSGTYVSTNVLIPHIYKYSYNDGEITPDISVDYIDSSEVSVEDNWREQTCTCIKSFSRKDIYNENIGLFFEIVSTFWLENIEFFPLVEGEKIINRETVIGRINPGEMEYSSIATVYHHYYNHTTHQSAIELDDYLYVGIEEWSNKSDLDPVSNNFAKVRSITAKQSNRFNLLQTLAETFECWCEFEIQHDSTGRVKYIDGKPQKFVRYKEKVGKELGFGFVYGIDLKTISRTIQSDQIVTKTIVSQNNNEFATNGFCTITRSPENYTRDTFILNFDYYVTQLLIDSSKLNQDLYSWFTWEDEDGEIQGSTTKGYYTQLRELNIAYDEITDLLVQKKTELTKLESYQTVYENYMTSLQQEKADLESRIMALANVNTWAAAQQYVAQNKNFTEISTALNAHENCSNNLEIYQSMYNSVTISLNNLASVLENKESEQQEIVSNIKELNYAFYRKYSNYIQEGSWTKEDYIDDTLYFLDAQSVAYTSSRPQISYNISVARLSSLEEFKNKVFHLGDISFIQDTEFFGYVYINQIKTPYKEKVLISEITSNFDNPSQDSFKVQNYKTQFEDLFQRITATTQTLQYASGEYARAAGIVETTGVIKPETLENSIAYNNGLVSQSNNEQIIQDQTGITVVDATNPNKRTKVTSGGIFISTDGGANWKNAVRGEGIATQYLTAGAINANNITILDGVHQTFRWDSTGINAYYNSGGQGINLSKFVRFDYYGIYGLETSNNSYVPSSEDDIFANAKFGMTWNRFFMKNKYGSGYVEISTDNDIRVLDGSNNERVKVGLLDGSGTQESPYIYGIRIKDGSGSSVMESGSDGNLWLRNKLKVGNGSSSTVSIGYDTVNTRTGTSYHEVIHAGAGDNEFIVYEDGYIKASGGIFTGTIEATGGHIGGVTIDEVQEAAYKVIIESSDGTIFKNGEGSKTLTAKLYKGADEVITGTFSYVWYKNGGLLVPTTKQITVSADSSDSTYVYDCIVTYTPPSV